MESRKRKREEDVSAALLTFHAPGDKRFDRLLRDPSLDEMKNAIRKKLKVSADSSIHLAQLRDGRKIDLDDEDDFDALWVLASKQKAVEISITVNTAESSGSGNASKQPTNTPSQSTAETPLAKKKSVNFSENLVVRTPTTQGRSPSTSRSHLDQPPPTPILRRSLDTTASVQETPHPEAGSSSTPLQKKRKRAASKDTAESQPEKVTATSTTDVLGAEADAKTKKQKKSKDPKDNVEDDAASKRSAVPLASSSQPSTGKKAIPVPTTAGSTDVDSAAKKKRGKSKATEDSAPVTAIKPSAPSVQDRDASKNATPVATTSTATGTAVKVASASGSSSVPAPKNASSSSTSKPSQPSFASQLVNGIATSLNTSSLSPEPEHDAQAATSTPKPSAESSLQTQQNKIKPGRPFSDTEIQAVFAAYETIRMRNTLKAKHPAMTEEELRSAADTAVASKKSASSTTTTAENAELTSHDDASSPKSQLAAASSQRVGDATVKETRPLPIVPGSAISEVTMEGRDEGSSSESSSESEDDEEEPWVDEGTKKDAGLAKLLQRAGVSSLEEVDMDAVLRGPVNTKKKGSVLAEIPESSGDEDDEDDDKLSEHKDSEDENDKSYRRLSRSLRKDGYSSDDEQEGEETTDLNSKSPLAADDATSASHPEVPSVLSAASAVSTPSSVEQEEVANALQGPSASVAASPDRETPSRGRQKSTSSPVPDESPATTTLEAENDTDTRSAGREGTATHTADPIQTAEDPEVPIGRPSAEEEDPIEPDVDDDDNEPAVPVQVAPKSPASKRMKNRRGEVLADVSEQPVLASKVVKPAASKQVAGKPSQTRSASSSAAADENAQPTPSSVKASSDPPAPTPATPASAEPQKKSRGRPKLTEEQKAANAAAKEKATASGTSAPKAKGRGRPKLSEEEKARRKEERDRIKAEEKEAAKGAEDEDEDEEKRKKAEKKAQQAEKKAQQAEKKAQQAEKKAQQAEKKAQQVKQRAASKPPSRQGKSVNGAPADVEGDEEVEVEIPATPATQQSSGSNAQSQPPSSSKWTALSQESEGRDSEPEADMTMIDELRSSSPDIHLSGRLDLPAPKTPARSKKDALFLQSQSQMTQLVPPSSSPRAGREDAGLGSEDDDEEAGWRKKAKLSKLKDIGSQDLFPPPTPAAASAAKQARPPHPQFPSLTSITSSLKSTPAPTPSQPARSSKPPPPSAFDDDDDESSGSESEAEESSHIPKEKRAGGLKKRKSSLGVWGSR
ncbi:hypothetical protein EIP91_006054 [Steccherinum ochraceum]|uniref:Uncharacterized protein n=1 Tax=Steccherinum ochraceum TaxID=92696 RepID=A0A4R0R6A2_9APHY|nr:hypothetical protein EIP91_006054 [Steccherinum ochraceum]